MDLLTRSVGFQTDTIWTFYVVIIVFFACWALIMLKAGMNKAKKNRD